MASSPASSSSSTTTPHPCDAEVIIVGGGAAGLSAALVLGRQRRMTVMLDSGDYRNSPSPAINMLPSSNHIDPADYLRSGARALAELETVTRLHSHVTSAEFIQVLDEAGVPCEGVCVHTREGRTIRGRRLIIATGQHDQLSVLPGASEVWGTHLLHCPYCHGWESRDHALVVLALGTETNPAAPMLSCYQALYLRQRLSEDVTLVTPSLPNEHFERCLQEAGVHVVLATPQRIGLDGTGENARVVVNCGEDTITADLAFATPPSEASINLGEQLGLEMNGAAIVVDHQQRSSHPIVFAAGDGSVQRGTPQPMTFVSQAQAHGQLAAIWADQDFFFSSPTTPAFPES